MLIIFHNAEAGHCKVGRGVRVEWRFRMSQKVDEAVKPQFGKLLKLKTSCKLMRIQTLNFRVPESTN